MYDNDYEFVVTKNALFEEDTVDDEQESDVNNIWNSSISYNEDEEQKYDPVDVDENDETKENVQDSETSSAPPLHFYDMQSCQILESRPPSSSPTNQQNNNPVCNYDLLKTISCLSLAGIVGIAGTYSIIRYLSANTNPIVSRELQSSSASRSVQSQKRETQPVQSSAQPKEGVYNGVVHFPGGTYDGDYRVVKSRRKQDGVMKDGYQKIGDGRGTFEYNNGDYYEGEWKNGKRSGYGKITWPSENYDIFVFVYFF